MRNNFTRPRGRSKGFLPESIAGAVIFLMRVSSFCVLFIVAGSHLLQAKTGYGQTMDNTFVDLREQRLPLRSVFSVLERETDFMFVFPVDVVEQYGDVTVPDGKQSVKTVLQHALRGSSLSFRESGKNVIIFEHASVHQESSSIVADAIKLILIKGSVTDNEGIPMPGVNVIVKGTPIGTSTDSEGTFSLDVPEDSKTLVFSFIGFRTFETEIGGRTTIDVVMESDAAMLQGVEIIDADYYTTTNKTKTGSIVKVPGKELENQPVTSLLMGLQGRVPGLEIAPNTGTPGGALKIAIRGRNSLRNNGLNDVANSPLFVIDGLPIDPTPIRSGSTTSVTLSGGYDPLAAINPANIESIEVLKDADATSIYGSRGANGVILITTKQNKQKGRTIVNVNAYTGVGKIVNRMDLLNNVQYLEMRKEAFANDETAISEWDFDVNDTWDNSRNTDWQDVLLGGSANIHDVQAGISGGNTNTSFKLDFGYHKEGVIYPGNFGYQRLSGNLALNHTSTNQKFSTSITVTYGANENSLFESTNFVRKALSMPPNAPPLYENGQLNWAIVDFDGFKINSFQNPLADLRNTNDSKSTNLIINGLLSYTLLPGLQLKSNLGYTELNGKEFIKFPMEAYSPTDIYPWTTGRNVFGRNTRNSWIAEPQIAYNKKIGGHTIGAVAGITWQRSVTDYQSINGDGYVSDLMLGNLSAASSLRVGADYSNEYKYNAVFMRMSYDWKMKYLISLTGRRDGSSRFGPGKQFGNFGAVGVGWVFSNESFVQDGLRFVSFGKLRGSYGVTGNDQIGDYMFFNTYRSTGNSYNDMLVLSPTSLFNPNYSWEATKKGEVAIELGFLDDRIFLEFGYYDNRSSNQLAYYQLPSITGFDGVTSNFKATVQNMGWEGMITFYPVRNDYFKWMTSLNISINRNKLLKFPGLESSSYSTTYQLGKPLSVRQMFVYEGVDQNTGEYKIKDFNDDGLLDAEDMQFMNLFEPKYYGGVNNTLSYKAFEISFLLQFTNQQKQQFDLGQPGVTSNMPTVVMDRWRKPGDATDIGKFTRSNGFFNDYVAQSNYQIKDASFIRLKTLSFSYTVPVKIVEKAKLSQAKVFVQGQNLFTLTDYQGFDPETGINLPPLRVMSLGVQIGF